MILHDVEDLRRLLDRDNLETAHTHLVAPESEVREAIRAEKNASDDKVNVRGADKALPPLPDDVEITEDDINKALDLWDEVMPDEKGQLDAEVKKDAR